MKAHGIAPQILLAIQAAEPIFADHGVDCVVTSLADGEHSPGSLHWLGRAVDFRTRTLDQPDEDQRVAGELRIALPTDYDIVVESDHLHLEWDPRGKP